MDELKKIFLTLLFFLIMAAVLIVLYGMQINKPQTNAPEIKSAISVDKLLPPAPADIGNANQSLSSSAPPTTDTSTQPSSHLSSKDSDFNSVNANNANHLAPAFETVPIGQSDMHTGQYMTDTDSNSNNEQIEANESQQTEQKVATEQVYETTHNFGSSSAMSSVNVRSNFIQNYAQADNINADYVPILYQAEQTGSAAAKAVLRQARIMALEDREIIQGACWDYLNAVFKRAGVSHDTVFKGAYPDGPFIAVDDIQVGDWLYYVNHSYHDIEHSGMFVDWVDKTQNQALILSYAGEHRQQPARYRVYDISHTYNVMRPTM